MKKILIATLIVAVTFGLVHAGFRYDLGTSDRIKMVDSAGNTMYFIDDDGTTGDLHIADITVDDDLTVTDALTVGGAATFSGTIALSGNVDINGSLLLDTMYVSYNSTLTATQSGLVISTGTAAFTLVLPAVSGNAGLTYTIKLDSAAAAAYAVTVKGWGSETIDGSNTTTQVDNWHDYITVICDGDEWFITAEKEH